MCIYYYYFYTFSFVGIILPRDFTVSSSKASIFVQNARSQIAFIHHFLICVPVRSIFALWINGICYYLHTVTVKPTFEGLLFEITKLIYEKIKCYLASDFTLSVLFTL